MPRFISLADLSDPAGASERRRKELETQLRRGELELKAQIEGYRLRQEDAHHRDQMEQDERHHADKMNALARSDALDAQRLEAVQVRDRGHLELGRDRLAFDRENALTTAETARETALIQARATVESAHIQQQGALEVAELNNRHATALAELNQRHALALAQLEHLNALDLIRAQSRTANADATTAILRESVLSQIRRGEEISKSLGSAIGSILVEKVRERHRANERKHEVAMAEYTARFARIGFTRDDLIRYGYSPSEADEILGRLISAINREPTKDIHDMARECLDEWERERAAKR